MKTKFAASFITIALISITALWNVYPAEAYHECLDVSNVKLDLLRRIGTTHQYRWSVDVYNKCGESHNGILSFQILRPDGVSLTHVHKIFTLRAKDKINISDVTSVNMEDPRTKTLIIHEKLRTRVSAETYHQVSP